MTAAGPVPGGPSGTNRQVRCPLSSRRMTFPRLTRPLRHRRPRGSVLQPEPLTLVPAPRGRDVAAIPDRSAFARPSCAARRRSGMAFLSCVRRGAAVQSAIGGVDRPRIDEGPGRHICYPANQKRWDEPTPLRLPVFLAALDLGRLRRVRPPGSTRPPMRRPTRPPDGDDVGHVRRPERAVRGGPHVRHPRRSVQRSRPPRGTARRGAPVAQRASTVEEIHSRATPVRRVVRASGVAGLRRPPRPIPPGRKEPEFGRAEPGYPVARLL